MMYKRKKTTEEVWATACANWLREESSGTFKNCLSYARKETLSCQCFALFLKNDKVALFVAYFLSYYATLTSEQRNMTVWTIFRSYTDMFTDTRLQPRCLFKLPYLTCLPCSADRLRNIKSDGETMEAVRLLEHTNVCTSALLHIF